MILLDTNVLSELMRPTPDRTVVAWLDRQPPGDMWICAVTVAELRLGVAVLPDGKRKAHLAEVTERYLDRFADACAPFDAPAAAEYASIVAARTRAGHPVSVEDAQIAAIARSGGLTLATRNVKDFEGIEGLKLVNPWVYGGSNRHSLPILRNR